MDYGTYEDGEIVDQPKKSGKQANVLPFFGNEATMNLNPLILTNIQSSSYFKVNLFKLKTYHEVVDEIYYQVKHMEPWERGSRKNPGVGMCGSVRGVGAGGIVSSAYCLLYKLYTLKLTRKQLNGLLNHSDSPYIRGLGFMYIRYTQPPAELYDWYEDYLSDEEEIDVKAGGGQTMTIGNMKQIESKLNEYARENNVNFEERPRVEERFEREERHPDPPERNRYGESSRQDRDRRAVVERSYDRTRERSYDRDRERRRERSSERGGDRDRYREEKKRSSEKEHHHKHKKSKHKHKSHEKSRERSRDRSYERKYR